MSSLVEVDPNPGQMVEVPFGEQGEPRREVNLLQLAWQSRWLILLCMIAGGGAGWAYLQRVTPLYTSRSRIYVERNLPQILASQVQAGQGASYLYTQAELIRSTGVLAVAAESRSLANLKSFKGVDNRVGLLKQCTKVVVGNQDDIINVSAELPDGEDAAQIVNAVVDAYVTKYAEKHRTDTVEVLNILRGEKERRDGELEERRKALADFRAQNSELAVQVRNETVIASRFSTLTEELSRTEMQLLEAKARYNRAKAMFDKPGERMYLLEAASADQKGTHENTLGTEVQSIERALTAERSQWGEGHPRVKLLRQSYDSLRKRLSEQQLAIVGAYVDRLRQEFEVLDQKQKELQPAYDRQFKLATDVSNKALQLNSLQEALERTEKTCDILDSRIKDLNLTEEVGAMNVSIMEAAVPGSLSYPVPSRLLGTGLFLGGLIGCGLAWLRDLLDHRLKSVEEIASVLQLPVLGALPFFDSHKGKSQAGRLVALSPRSTSAEAVRTLRTALHFGLAGNDSKIIVITSPSPGDGKSTVASNLAIAMAQADQRVLLIDADLRKPTQHKIFEVSNERGLATVLTERCTVEEVVAESVTESLDLLSSGSIPGNPVELLNNGFFAELLEKLREKYDKVVIDSPPVMAVADARIIAALGDATLLVLRAERSTRRPSLAARNELWRVRATRLGVVINGVPSRKAAYGYGHGYGYGGPGGQYGYIAYGYGEDEPSDRRKKRALLAKPAAENVTAADSA